MEGGREERGKRGAMCPEISGLKGEGEREDLGMGIRCLLDYLLLLVDFIDLWTEGQVGKLRPSVARVG